MASMRCPKCNTPVTDDEMRAGMCLMCDAVLPPQAPAAGISKPLPSQPAAPSNFVYSMLVAVIGAVAFCFLPVGIIFYNMLPENTASKNDKAAEQQLAPKKEPRAEVKPTPTPEPKPAEETGDGPKKPDLKKTEPEKKVEKEEPKPTGPQKIEQPKVVEQKPDEPKKNEDPKKPDPKPMQPIAPPQLANAYLPLLDDDAIKIDGDLADWKDLKPIFLSAIERGRPTKKVVVLPKTQKVYLAYCSKGILVAVEAVDTSGALENAGKPARGMWPFWDNDAVEIYIDTLNQRPQRRGAANLHQFFAFPLGTLGDAGIGGYESRILRNAAGREDWTIVPHSNVGVNAMLRAGKKTLSGWTMEILIPRSVLRHGDLKPGQILGFELQIDTGTNVFYFWANDNPQVHVSTSPSAWGEVGLAGTDARIELLDADNKPAKTLTVGKPLTVRVTDADLNLVGKNKERTAVTLVSKSGDRKTVLLEETLPNSGIFVGSIATRMSGGKKEDAVLEVRAADSIVVEYLDLIRANSTRNVLLRAEVAVAAK